MGLTPVYNWPYPELNNPPDGATQMKNLALAIEPTVRAVQNPPVVQLRQSVAQSIPNNGAFMIFEAEDIDTHGMHSPTTNPSRITATVAGWYLVWGSVSFASGTTGRRGSYAAVNGGLISGSVLMPMTTSITIVPVPTVVCHLNVNDYVEIQAYQDSGAAVLTYVGSTANKSHAGAHWISPY